LKLQSIIYGRCLLKRDAWAQSQQIQPTGTLCTCKKPVDDYKTLGLKIYYINRINTSSTTFIFYSYHFYLHSKTHLINCPSYETGIIFSYKSHILCPFLRHFLPQKYHGTMNFSTSALHCDKTWPISYLYHYSAWI
jgi:hypothetical protein